MSTTQLTDRQFWFDYWESKSGLAFEVGAQYPFIHDLDTLIQKNDIRTLLEIGGFPGYFSVWAARHRQVEATLFDFVIHPRILHELEAANQLPIHTIKIIEADLFQFTPTPTYDLVVSNGLIEHFLDTADIIRKHAAFVRPGGQLLITLPNFRGLNGWFQRTFDPDNYAKHNIGCMDIGFLSKTCDALGLKEVEVRYEGRFMLWLENIEQQPWWVRVFLKATWLPLKIFFKLIPVETRFFSPYLLLTARV